jgi:hypothetical protein
MLRAFILSVLLVACVRRVALDPNAIIIDAPSFPETEETVHPYEVSKCEPLGIDMTGHHIPRKGLENPSLFWFTNNGTKRLLDVVEPMGEVATLGGQTFVKGRLSFFGGSEDPGIGEIEKGSVTGEILRDLSDYFVAMRFDLSGNKRKFWRRARLLVINPLKHKAVVLRPVDWGPNPAMTKRIIDLSLKARDALEVDTDQSVLVSFTSQSTPVGPIDCRTQISENDKE